LFDGGEKKIQRKKKEGILDLYQHKITFVRQVRIKNNFGTKLERKPKREKQN
jgi:hypothetical protein